jgi:hypothetical protein
MDPKTPQTPGEERPREKKRWEPPAFISEEALELIAGLCSGSTPPNKALGAVNCTTVSS